MDSEEESKGIENEFGAESGEDNPFEEQDERAEELAADVIADGEKKIAVLTAREGAPEDIAEMRESADKSADQTQTAKDAYYEESREGESAEKRELVNRFVMKNYGRIADVTRGIYGRLGVELDAEAIRSTVGQIAAEALRDPDLVRTLKDSELIDGRTAALITFLSPYIEKTLKGGRLEEKIPDTDLTRKAEKIVRAYRGITMDACDKDRAKEVAAAVLPAEENDPRYIGQAGEMLDKLADEYEGTQKGLVLKGFALLLRSETFQRLVSEKFRTWLKQRDEDGTSGRETIEDIIQAEM